MRNTLSVLALLTCAVPLGAEEEAPFREEPAARALYEKMLDALREAKTLRYTSSYRWESEGREIGRCTYRAWLRKPNQFRLETTRRDGTEGGVLVGDGDHLWIHWPDGRPLFNTDDEAQWRKNKDRSYLTEPTPPGAHSIAHQTPLLGAGMSMAILNPSRFHGAGSSLDPYRDGVRGLGAEEIDGETFDVIEISYMAHQRSVYLWLSRRDHLPRRLKQVVRVSSEITSHETWTDVRVDAAMEDGLFAWTPPEGWVPWRPARQRERLLKAGTKAPGFRLQALDGGRLALADYRGKIVWLVFWRAG